MVLPVELPDDVDVRVSAVASARGVSGDAVVIEAVEAFLARRSSAVSAPRDGWHWPASVSPRTAC